LPFSTTRQREQGFVPSKVLEIAAERLVVVASLENMEIHATDWSRVQ